MHLFSWRFKGMRRSRNFRQGGGGGGGGGPGQSDKKSSANVFFSPLTAYFTEVKWLISKIPEGVQHFPGGSNFFQGGGGGPITYSL